MKVLTQAFLTLGGLALGIAGNFAFWFYLAGTDPDPTVGGAYCAMMALCTVPAALVGTLLGIVLATRVQ